MAASLPVMVTLSMGEDQDVITGPCVLTDLIVTELTGAASAVISIADAEDSRTYLTVSVVAGQTVCWHGRFVIGGGINVGSQSGDVAVTIGYY